MLNTFFGNDFNGFNVLNAANPEEDGDIPVSIFTAESDHIIDPNMAIALQEKLPDSSAVFIWQGRHVREGNVRDFYIRQATSLLTNGCLNEPLIQASLPLLARYNYQESYINLLRSKHTSQQLAGPSQSYAVTASLLTPSSIEPCSSSSMTIGDYSQPSSSGSGINQQALNDLQMVMGDESADMDDVVSAIVP